MRLKTATNLRCRRRSPATRSETLSPGVIRLSKQGWPMGRPKGTFKDRSREHCLCGNPSVKIKFNEPVCAVCDGRERHGFTGGPLIREIVQSPRRRAHKIP